MLSQPTAIQSKIHEEFQGVFGKNCCCECLFFTCTMKSRPCPSTPEVGIWRHEKHDRSFLQHLQLQLLAPWRGHICDSAHLTLSRVCWYPTGRSWYFLLQDVRSACLPAWENADVPESIFSWTDAERRHGAGRELSGPAGGAAQLLKHELFSRKQTHSCFCWTRGQNVLLLF